MNTIQIRDIYHGDAFEAFKGKLKPSGLTPLQEIEWNELNAQSISEYNDYCRRKPKQLVGKILVAAPALIDEIGKNKIIAHAKYQGGNLYVSYEIKFNSTLHEAVKLIYNKSKVELEGQILKFNEKINIIDNYNGDPIQLRVFNIQIELAAIKVLEKEEISSFLLLKDSDLDRIKEDEQNKKEEEQNIKYTRAKDSAIVGLASGAGLGAILGVILGIFMSFWITLITVISIGAFCGGIIGWIIGYLEDE